MVDSFFAFALASVLILQFRVHPEWFDAVLVLAFTLLFATVDFRFLHFAPKVMPWFSFAGVSSLLIMGIRAVWAEARTTRKMLLYAAIPALLFVSSDYFASNMLDWTTAAHPQTLDLYLLSFDYSLRVELASLAGQLFVNNHWIHNVSLLVYVGLAIPISLVYAGRLVRFGERAFPSMLAFLITGPVGILFYNIFPACGPHALFQQGFPFHPFPMAQASRLLLEPLAVAGPRNAIPSLHLAWALLAWWYSRGLSWFERLIAFSFLAITAFATLGTGEHWFIDLIVAFPFALMIQALCAYSLRWNDRTRLTSFLFGLFATMGWLVILRFGAKFFWTSPVVPWALAAATVVLATIRQAKVDQAVDASTKAIDGPSESVRVPAHGVPISAL
ncbi:MAG TPA: phosphatase PAP2 family protein [Candidatus Angelobacter sp.]|nr:phosphatase PAP2 family protein [Candidatus Angelobacter sp.]